MKNDIFRSKHFCTMSDAEQREQYMEQQCAIKFLQEEGKSWLET